MFVFFVLVFLFFLTFLAALYLGHVRELQLQLSEVLAAVGVPPHSGGRWDGSAGVRVDAPALAPLTVERHLALKHKLPCFSLFLRVCCPFRWSRQALADVCTKLYSKSVYDQFCSAHVSIGSPFFSVSTSI